MSERSPESPQEAEVPFEVQKLQFDRQKLVYEEERLRFDKKHRPLVLEWAKVIAAWVAICGIIVGAISAYFAVDRLLAKKTVDELRLEIANRTRELAAVNEKVRGAEIRASFLETLQKQTYGLVALVAGSEGDGDLGGGLTRLRWMMDEAYELMRDESMAEVHQRHRDFLTQAEVLFANGSQRHLALIGEWIGVADTVYRDALATFGTLSQEQIQKKLAEEDYERLTVDGIMAASDRVTTEFGRELEKFVQKHSKERQEQLAHYQELEQRRRTEMKRQVP